MSTNQPSGFNNFSSNYEKVDIIDNDTYKNRKPYSKEYWITTPARSFFINLNEIKPFKCFLRVSGEQFGDAIVPRNISNFSFKFKCYDDNGKIIIKESASLNDDIAGEIQYTFGTLDFPSTGQYFAEIEITDDKQNIFCLPSSNLRLSIIVN